MARTEGAGRWCRADRAGMHGMETSQSLTTPVSLTKPNGPPQPIFFWWGFPLRLQGPMSAGSKGSLRNERGYRKDSCWSSPGAWGTQQNQAIRPGGPSSNQTK